MADVQNRVTDLENEIKVLKNEIKAILLDIREQYLNTENPFTIAGQPSVGSGPVVNVDTAGGGPAVDTVISNLPRSATTFKEAQPSAQPLSEEAALEESQGHHEEGDSGASDALFSPNLEPTGEEETATKGGRRSKRGTSSATFSRGQESHAQEDELRSKGGEPGARSSVLPPPSLEPFIQEEDELLSKAEGADRTGVPRKRAKQATAHRNGSENGDDINLLTIAGLSKWVDESTDKIGKERTEVMVEACHLVGHLSLELKDLLIRLVRLAQVDEPRKAKITTRDYLGVIAQLDSLLGYSNESEAALLTILADSRDFNNG